MALSYKIKVFDAPKMVEIIDLFAIHFNVNKIPESLFRVQNIIKVSQKDQFYAGVGPAPFRNDWDSKTRATGILNLNSLLAKLQDDLHQDWAAFEIDTVIYLDFGIPTYLANLKGEILKTKLFASLNQLFVIN